MKKIMKLFSAGNVCVCGLRGRGKDMLMSNVAVRRKLPYVSNTDYGGDCIKFVPMEFDCGQNTYDAFLNNALQYYKYPHPDGTDVYIGDAGVYFPSQYCGELNKRYGYFSTFMALSRHLGECNVHFNVQNLNRVWDKIREQSDIYIMCNWCKVFFGRFVVQQVTIYENYDSAVARVPPYKAPSVGLNADRKMNVQLDRQRYRIAHGAIKRRLLFYRNKSNYNTRIFRDLLLSGKKSRSR